MSKLKCKQCDLVRDEIFLPFYDGHCMEHSDGDRTYDHEWVELDEPTNDVPEPNAGMTTIC